MANSGPATNASQFYNTWTHTLANGKHTIFGHVTDGMNVVNTIAQGDVITKVTVTRKELWQRKNLMQLKCSQTTQQ
jgi:cyclophilin family peptidyl-prolyl cis-trans isomerase